MVEHVCHSWKKIFLWLAQANPAVPLFPYFDVMNERLGHVKYAQPCKWFTRHTGKNRNKILRFKLTWHAGRDDQDWQDFKSSASVQFEMCPNLRYPTTNYLSVSPCGWVCRRCLLPLSEMSRVPTHETRGNSSWSTPAPADLNCGRKTDRSGAWWGSPER